MDNLNITKNQLTAVARECGFISSVIGKSVDSKSSKPFYYLWMCELRKWLCDTHEIEVIPNVQYNQCVRLGHYYGITTKEDSTFSKPIYKTFDDALEAGLYVALKLINKS